MLIAAGANALAITVYLGHSSVAITYGVYGHLMPGNEAEAAGLLGAYLQEGDGVRPGATTSRQWTPRLAGRSGSGRAGNGG